MSPEPENPEGQPGARHTNRGARNSEPGARNPEPGARNSEPGARNSEPGARNSEPGGGNTTPGARDTEAGADVLEVIDAFVDGHRVNAPELKRALAEEEGRNYFVDAWLLRESLQDEMAAETIPHARTDAASGRWILPVAVSLISLIGGSYAGYRLAQMADSTAPPIVSPATPAPAGPATQTPSFPVPAPTRAIPIEFSADTTGATGGD